MSYRGVAKFKSCTKECSLPLSMVNRLIRISNSPQPSSEMRKGGSVLTERLEYTSLENEEKKGRGSLIEVGKLLYLVARDHRMNRVVGIPLN